MPDWNKINDNEQEIIVSSFRSRQRSSRDRLDDIVQNDQTKSVHSWDDSINSNDGNHGGLEQHEQDNSLDPENIKMSIQTCKDKIQELEHKLREIMIQLKIQTDITWKK